MGSIFELNYLERSIRRIGDRNWWKGFVIRKGWIRSEGSMEKIPTLGLFIEVVLARYSVLFHRARQRTVLPVYLKNLSKLTFYGISLAKKSISRAFEIKNAMKT